MEQFEENLQAVRSVVTNYVRFRLADGPEWEDVAQEVFTLAYLKYGQLRHREAFKGWILSIARNQCAEYYRRQGRGQTVPLDDVSEGLATAQEPDSVADAVEDTLKKLRPEDQELLHLAYWEELPQSSIAQRLGIPVGTVKSRLHKAKQRFRAEYPYPPKQKGDYIMEKFPKIMPEYTASSVFQIRGCGNRSSRTPKPS